MNRAGKLGGKDFVNHAVPLNAGATGEPLRYDMHVKMCFARFFQPLHACVTGMLMGLIFDDEV